MTTRIRKLLPRDKRDELFGYSAQARADRAAVAEEDFLCRQYPRTKDFILAQSFKRSFGNGGDGDGFAYGIEDFDGVTLAAVARDMVVNELDDVAALEPVLGHVAGQNGVFV